jgi:hypothetical protein
LHSQREVAQVNQNHPCVPPVIYLSSEGEPLLQMNARLVILTQMSFCMTYIPVTASQRAEMPQIATDGQTFLRQ